MKKFVCAAMFVLIASPCLAQSAAQPPATKDLFDHLDTNKDNVLTKAEHDAQGNTFFNNADKDKDGKISAVERDAVRKMWKDNMAARAAAKPAAK